MYKYLFLFYHTAVGLIGSIATLINFIAPHGIEETDTVLAAEKPGHHRSKLQNI